MVSEECCSGVDMQRGRIFGAGKISKINFFVSCSDVFTAKEH